MKFRRLLGPSTGGPSGPGLVMEGGRAHPEKRSLTKGKSYDLSDYEVWGSNTPKTVWPGVQVGSAVVSQAGAVARKSVFRGMAVVVVQVGYVYTVRGGSN